jgi:hypothetical protein
VWNTEYMLTKEDREQIQETIKASFQDFYENLFEPLVTKNQQEHEQIMRRLEKLDRKDELHKDILRGHEGRITDLERKSF